MENDAEFAHAVVELRQRLGQYTWEGDRSNPFATPPRFNCYCSVCNLRKGPKMTTADFRFDPRDEAGSFEVLSGSVTRIPVTE